MTNTYNMIPNKILVGAWVKGMTRSAHPGIHVICGIRYGTPIYLHNQMTGHTVCSPRSGSLKTSGMQVNRSIVDKTKNEKEIIGSNT